MLNKMIELVNNRHKVSYSSEEKDYQDNYNKKKKLIDYLIENYHKKENSLFSEIEFGTILEKVLKTFSDNTGCSDDLEILENLFDKLFELKIIDTNTYKKTIESSPVNRWL